MSNEKQFSDQSIMPFGKHKGEKLANVPASYLLWLYENNKCYGSIRGYIVENLEVIKKQNI